MLLRFHLCGSIMPPHGLKSAGPHPTARVTRKIRHINGISRRKIGIIVCVNIFSQNLRHVVSPFALCETLQRAKRRPFEPQTVYFAAQSIREKLRCIFVPRSRHKNVPNRYSQDVATYAHHMSVHNAKLTDKNGSKDMHLWLSVMGEPYVNISLKWMSGKYNPSLLNCDWYFVCDLFTYSYTLLSVKSLTFNYCPLQKWITLLLIM